MWDFSQEMMSYYHKKQEEMKKLQEDDEDNYLGRYCTSVCGLKQLSY
jgi:hypothetical protein